jgi:cell division transport system permease protein
VTAFFTAHRNALRRALVQLASQPLGTLLSLSVLGCALAIPLALHSALASIKSATYRIGADAEVNVFMDPKASLDDASKLRTTLSALPDVTSARLVSKEAALETLKQRPQLADLVGSLEGNPLPHAVILKPARNDPATLDRLRAEVTQLPGVDRVSADFEWVRKLRRIVALGEAVIFAAALLLSVAVVLVIGNTIRLEVLTRRDEIAVSTLIGASTSFVRRPFLYFGFLAGALSALLGWGIAVAGIIWANSHVSALAAEYGFQFSIMLPGPIEATAYILAIAFLALLGATLSATTLARQR